MTSGSLQDRRQLAQNQLDAMAFQPGTEHPTALRSIVASVLSFTPVTKVTHAHRRNHCPR